MSTVREHLDGERIVSSALCEQPGQERAPLAASEELIRLLRGYEPTAEKDVHAWRRLIS